MNVMITGTSSGIGHALALYYLGKGHHVLGISRKHSPELEAFPEFRFLSQDISIFDDLSQNLEKILENSEPLDIVILNAGILPEIKDLGATGLDEIKHIMDVNVWANKIIIDTLFGLRADTGQVVAISSGAAINGSRGWNAYALSKATLNMLMDLYSKEHPGTHFTALAPGIINTGMQEYIRSLPESNQYPVVNKLRQLYENAQMPEPEEEAGKLVKAFSAIRRMKSGSYVDVRDIPDL